MKRFFYGLFRIGLFIGAGMVSWGAIGSITWARIGADMPQISKDYGLALERLSRLEVLPGEEVWRFVSGEIEVVVHFFEGKSYWEKYRRVEGSFAEARFHRREVEQILNWSAGGYSWTKPRREGEQIIWDRKDGTIRAVIDQAQENMQVFHPEVMERRRLASEDS